MCVYVGAWVHTCACVHTCEHACVCVYPQYSPMKMHTNTMMTIMIMQTMTIPPTMPTTTGTTEDGGEDGAVG